MKQIILTLAVVAASTVASARSILPAEEATNTFIIEASDREQLEVVLVEEGANTSCNAVSMSGVETTELFEVAGNVYVPTIVGYRLQPAGYISTLIACDPSVKYAARDIRGSITLDITSGKAMKIVTPRNVTRIEVNPAQ